MGTSYDQIKNCQEIIVKTFVLAFCIQYIQRITFAIFFIKINFQIQNTVPKTMILRQSLFIVFLYNSFHYFERLFLAYCINSYYSSSDSLFGLLNIPRSIPFVVLYIIEYFLCKTKKSFRKLHGRYPDILINY